VGKSIEFGNDRRTVIRPLKIRNLVIVTDHDDEVHDGPASNPYFVDIFSVQQVN